MPSQNFGHGRPGYPYQGGEHRQNNDPIAGLLTPSAKLPVYFASNDRNAPRHELFDSEAREVAEKLKLFPATQLRRFYASVIALRQQLELDKEIPDELVRARMAQLKAHAAYTLKRDKHYPHEFVRFFTDHAAAVKDRHDFLFGFQPHFEAVVAYHKVFEVKNGERA